MILSVVINVVTSTSICIYTGFLFVPTSPLNTSYFENAVDFTQKKKKTKVFVSIASKCCFTSWLTAS